MREIVAALLDANPHVRIVANAITLETVGEILACMREFEFATGEITQIWAAPVDTVGSYHMPKAQNPVYVAVMQDQRTTGERYNGRSYDSGSGKRKRQDHGNLRPADPS